MILPHAVYDGPHLRAALCPAQGQQVLVTFDFRKHGRHGFGPAPKPGRLRDMGWDHLHLSTARNDWFLNPDTGPMLQTLAPCLAGFDRVHVLGYSMGAYAALRFAMAFGAHRVTAVSPFVSLLPEVAPWETRHTQDRPFWHEAGPMAAIPPAPEASGQILVDPDLSADLAHARALAPLFPNLELILLPGGGHPASKRQRESGQGGAVLAQALGIAANASSQPG